MKSSEAMLAWTPGTDQVEVGPWPDKTGWSSRYECTVLGCFTDVQAMSSEERKLNVLCEALTMVMRDRVDIDAAHRELMKLEEYRDALPEDAW